MLNKPDEFEKSVDDTILVMPSTDPAWLPLLRLASGLIVEMGGLLSHGSVIAREYGLPAVANIPDATKRFQTGDRVLVDGSTGVVQLFGGTLTAVAAFVLLFRISAPMTLMAIVPLILFGFIAMKAFGSIRPIFRLRGKISAEVTGRLNESLNGIRVIKGFNAEEREINVFSSGVDRLFQNVRRSLTASSLVTSLR